MAVGRSGMEVQQAEKSPRFYGVLRKHSQNQFDPVSEWEYKADAAGNGEGRCICSTPIFHEYVIQNKLTGEQLTIGSECIARWFHSSLRCEKCNGALGNVNNRIKKDNYICAKCNRDIKKKKKELANTRLFLFPHQKNLYPHYRYKMFHELIEDTEAVETLINLPEKTRTLELFEEYVGLHYKIDVKVI